MDEVLKNIGFDWQVALANFINFMLILFILKRYVFKPTREVIEKRRELIQKGIDNTKNSETELLVAKQKVENSLKEAHKEANKIIAEAKKNGDNLIARAEEKAQAAAGRAMNEAEKNIAQQKKQLEKELFDKTASLVVRGVEKVLDKDFSEDDEKSLYGRVVEGLKQQ